MASKFIPSFHFMTPEQKLTEEFASAVINYYYHNTHNVGLLDDKNVDEIDKYSTGDFDMTPFKKMYKSMKRKMKMAQHPNAEVDDTDTVGLDWKPFPLIPTKLNSAVTVVHKIPLEINCKAIDALAAEKKEEDLSFLKNKPRLEEDLQDFADQMMIGSLDLGTTKHSAIKFSSSPYGLDLNDPDELEVFVNLLYSLGVESAFETALEQFWHILNGHQVKLLETRDQFKYGVSCNRSFPSAITGLPDFEYVHPSNVRTPKSRLPDFSDRTHDMIEFPMTAMEFFNYFGNEIRDEDHMDEILNGKETGYCCRNKLSTVDVKNWETFKMNVVFFEVKSVDAVGVARNKSGHAQIVDASKAKEKLWGQNTYCFYWLKNTNHFFHIHKLDYSFRQKGREAFQTFSLNIYKSQEKSAVELCIGENKKAQTADIKLQHAIAKSLPSGKYIDLRFVRGALTGLKKEEANEYTMDTLIALALEQNIIIADTEGFEGKNDGQLKPVIDLVGGLKREEVEGYMRVIAQCAANISNHTGINEQLTGQSANPEGLVGMQKLLINSSLNALYYCNEAIGNQYQRVFTIWSALIMNAIERGGKTKEAIVSLVGSKKASLIDALDEIPLHNIGVKISLEQREEERMAFEMKLAKLSEVGIITTADEYMLKGIRNPKDRFALLAVKEKQYLKRKEAERKEGFQNQQQLINQQNEGRIAAVNAEVEGKIKQIYAKADAEGKIRTLASQLGMNERQVDGLIKSALQKQRSQQQIDKSIMTLQTKASVDQQKAIGVI